MEMSKSIVRKLVISDPMSFDSVGAGEAAVIAAPRAGTRPWPRRIAMLSVVVVVGRVIFMTVA
jgi:hypothetical protein